MTNADNFFGGAPALSYPRANDVDTPQGGRQRQYTDQSLKNVVRGGLILDTPQVTNQTDMNGKPLFWDDGSPKQQMIVTVLCDGSRGGARDERNPANPADTGKRRIYIKSGLGAAVRDGLLQVGATTLSQGGEWYIDWTGETPPKPNMDPARLYAQEYEVPPVALPAAPDHASAAPQAASPAGSCTSPGPARSRPSRTWTRPGSTRRSTWCPRSPCPRPRTPRQRLLRQPLRGARLRRPRRRHQPVPRPLRTLLRRLSPTRPRRHPPLRCPLPRPTPGRRHLPRPRSEEHTPALQ